MLSILPSLQSLGLTEKEAQVYAALFRMKKGTALTIAKTAGIKRPTVYGILQSLQQKKLVSLSTFRGVRDFRILPLEHLKHYVHDQKRQADLFLPAMQELYKKREAKSRLRIYHDIADIKTLLEKSLRERSVLYCLGDEQHVANTLSPYWEFYLKRARQRRITPRWKSMEGTLVLFLWSDKVAFADIQERIQVFGFKNHAMHKLYQELWNRF